MTTSRALSSPARRNMMKAIAILGAAPCVLHAQGGPGGFPERQIRIVVPYPPGGSNDVIARVLSQKFQQAWGQPAIVDNKPGAAGNIGAAEVAKAAPDGYTLLLTNVNITSMNPALYTHMPFDPQKDFAPVSLLATSALVLVVNPKLQVHSVRELIQYLKEHPGKVTCASSGNGSPQHVSAELFKEMTATHFVHIPYRGAAPALTDVLSGQVDMTFGVTNQLLPHVRAGRLRAIAVTSTKRLPYLADVPTLSESGVPGYESEIWLGLAAPAGTPAEVISRLNQEVRKALADPDTVKQLAAQGLDVLVSTPGQMRQRAAADLKRWTSVIQHAGIKSE